MTDELLFLNSGTWNQHQILTRGPRSIPDPLLSVDSLLQYNTTVFNNSTAGINYTSNHYCYYSNCWWTHNSHIAGAVFVGVADGLTKLLQPLPQVAGLGDAHVDALFVVELYLKPQLVLPEACTYRENTRNNVLALKQKSYCIHVKATVIVVI